LLCSHSFTFWGFHSSIFYDPKVVGWIANPSIFCLQICNNIEKNQNSNQPDKKNIKSYLHTKFRLLVSPIFNIFCILWNKNLDLFSVVHVSKWEEPFIRNRSKSTSCNLCFYKAQFSSDLQSRGSLLATQNRML